MATEFLSDVRNELQSRSTRTTIDELKKKGLDQVRVIRSSQILELIEQAVDRALARRGAPERPGERQELLQDSTTIFRDMLRSEMQQQQGAAQKNFDELKQRLEQDAVEMRSLEERLSQRDGQLSEALARQAELDAELRVLRQRSQAGSPQDLLEELRSLRKEIARPPAPVVVAAPAPAAAPTGALEQRIQSLGAELASQIDRIGRKVGVTNVADDAPVELSGLFQSIPELEGNLDAVEAKERKGSDVSDALARMKSMRGPKSDA
ncbi:MAG: hypothetical protein JNL90_12590 [Planctomycetes bacterium]|nr:hypothetical protein [Planctomycetota bacterium]